MVHNYSVLKKHRFPIKKLLSLLILIITTFAAFAQNINLKGRVTDSSSGEAIPGVNVLLKGTGTGVSTDSDGAFTLPVPSDGTLVFSFLGYKTVEVAVGARSSIDVIMESEASLLSEVVVVGYGTVEKKYATGAMANVTSKEFNKGLIAGPEQLLAGKVAGLQITPSGQPGGRADIRLRGVSLNGEYPLIVVDGVILDGGGGGVTGAGNPLSFINPSDIESINVLKDAQTTAIYGSRGANGIIMITTKSGVTGKPRFTYDGLYSVSVFTRKPDVFDAAEYRELVRVKAPNKLSDLGNSNTNWLDEVTRIGHNTQHNFGVSGGVKKTTYHASLNYILNQGVLNKTGHQRGNISLQVKQKLLDDNLQLTLNTKNGITEDQFGDNVIGAASAFDPTQPVRQKGNKETGGFFQWDNSNAVANPVATQEQQSRFGNTYRNVSNLIVKYDIPFLKGLSFNANFAIDFNSGATIFKRDSAARGNSNGTIRSKYAETQLNHLYEYYGNYNATFGKHKIDITGGYAWQDFRKDYKQKSFSDENPTTPFPVPPTPLDENRLISFFGRGNYDYAGKYLVTFSYRRDGSTRFGTDKRWGVFPSVGVAWRVMEEGFAQGLSNIFSEMKLRASYGITGNEQIGNYKYSTYYVPSLPGASYQFGDEYVSTFTPSGGDSRLKWEENEQINAALDLGILDGRIILTFDAYQRTVYDLLFTISPQAGSIPDDQLLTNIGSVRNRGLEFVSNVVAFDRENFDWNFSLNASYNQNEITKLDNLKGQALEDFPGYPSGGIAGDVGQTIQIRKVGQPIDAFYVYQHKRKNGNLVLDTNGDGIQSKLEMYEDLNNDGIINEDDLRPYKQLQPKVQIGFTSNMTYKAWDLTFTLRGNFGNYVYNNLASSTGYYQVISDAGVTNNVHKSVLETGFKTRQLFSDYYVQNASFVKVDNITLGYNFNNINFLRTFRAYLTAQNPLVISKYKGMEPEQFYGIDNSPYPRSMTITLGLNATLK